MMLSNTIWGFLYYQFQSDDAESKQIIDVHHVGTTKGSWENG